LVDGDVILTNFNQVKVFAIPRIAEKSTPGVLAKSSIAIVETAFKLLVLNLKLPTPGSAIVVFVLYLQIAK
jgi:hypothetical protein